MPGQERGLENFSKILQPLCEEAWSAYIPPRRSTKELNDRGYPQCAVMTAKKLTTTTNVWLFTLAASASVLTGCARTTTVSPEDAFRETRVESEEITDDLDLAGLRDALSEQRAVLRNKPDTTMRFGKVTISRGAYGKALDKLAGVLLDNRPTNEKLRYIGDNFRFFEIYGGNDWGEILLTSYFEPIIHGSLQRTDRFSQPLYAKPHDLITIDLQKFSPRFKDESTLRARVHEGKALPYYSRHEIDSKGALQGKGLEICWVDPIDAFFLQIQGSGTVKLQSGEELFITYAEKNGHKYEPIGKFLKERISPMPVTMQRIEAVAKTMSPKEKAELFEKNPSYVFFTKSKRRALTSLGVPATPGRTIAADPKFAPKGALAFVTFTKPTFSESANGEIVESKGPRVSRFVLDQDSGGAITGTDHIDLFWGRGDEAKKVAGVLQDRARILYLVPRDKETGS